MYTIMFVGPLCLDRASTRLMLLGPVLFPGSCSRPRLRLISGGLILHSFLEYAAVAPGSLGWWHFTLRRRLIRCIIALHLILRVMQVNAGRAAGFLPRCRSPRAQVARLRVVMLWVLRSVDGCSSLVVQEIAKFPAERDTRVARVWVQRKRDLYCTVQNVYCTCDTAYHVVTVLRPGTVWFGVDRRIQDLLVHFTWHQIVRSSAMFAVSDELDAVDLDWEHRAIACLGVGWRVCCPGVLHLGRVLLPLSTARSFYIRASHGSLASPGAAVVTRWVLSSRYICCSRLTLLVEEYCRCYAEDDPRVLSRLVDGERDLHLPLIDVDDALDAADPLAFPHVPVEACSSSFWFACQLRSHNGWHVVGGGCRVVVAL